MPSSPRRPALLLTTAALSAVGLTAAVAAVSLPGSGALDAARAGAVAAPVPVVTSENVSLVTTVPESQAISLEFARTGDFAYISSLDTISVLDISDPLAPKVTGTLVNALFENEAMTYGERIDENGDITRFVIAGMDFYQASPTDPEHVNVLGNEIAIVDVTDPTKPFIRSYAETTTSTHTVQCVDQANCTTAYTAGTSGEFSVLDLTDLDNPAELHTIESRAAGDGGDHSSFSGGFGAGHYWDFDGVYGWHTGSGGATAFDLSDPEFPVAVNGTDANGRAPGFNDFILHNSMRPNGDVFVEDAPPSVWNGNVLLATEEDYLDVQVDGAGEELDCTKSGSFQTWHIPTAVSADYQETGTGNISNLDLTNAPAEFGDGLSTPAAAFCSAHWFDYHQNGFVAQGWYGAGLRIMDVRDAANIDQVGYATTAVTEVWDAYWVPVRDDAGVVTGEKTDIVYTIDATRGLDVYEVTLPELTAADLAAKAAMEQRRADNQSGDGTGGETGGEPATGPNAHAAHGQATADEAKRRRE